MWLTKPWLPWKGTDCSSLPPLPATSHGDIPITVQGLLWLREIGVGRRGEEGWGGGERRGGEEGGGGVVRKGLEIGIGRREERGDCGKGEKTGRSDRGRTEYGRRRGEG